MRSRTLNYRAMTLPSAGKCWNVVQNRYWRRLREAWDPADAFAGLLLISLTVGYGWCWYKLIAWIVIAAFATD